MFGPDLPSTKNRINACLTPNLYTIFMKKRTIIGILFGLSAIAFGWAAETNWIPFDEWRYHNPVLTFLYGLINLPVVIATALTGIVADGPVMVMFFIWWFIVGFIGTWIVQRYFRMRDSQLKS